MTEPKFTPGPWKLEARRDICDEFECWLEPINIHIHDKISDADAHLIAAAPELYEALEKIRHWGESQHKAQSKGGHATFDMMMLREQIDTAEAALAKARGESHD